jgi:hypothetical protein
MMDSKISRIFMTWRSGRSHSRLIVGVIKSTASETTFHYFKDGVDKAKSMGFTCYPDFPKTNPSIIYDKNVMRILSQRINNPERTDIDEYYRFWEISEEIKTSQFKLLAYTSGILPTDNFEFLAEFYSIRGLRIVSELIGLSDNPLENSELSEGDNLEWECEPKNKYDPKAVVLSKNRKKLGYVKLIHSHVFYMKGNYALKVSVKKIEHNGHINKVFILIAQSDI